MGHSTALATAATGGVLQSTILQTPGSSSWSMTKVAVSGATSISRMVFQFVASGIDSQ